ncbi:30S ribosomal protein S2 [Candidatus Woesearchaeota archaeon]|nr:30S ribosomal protein S2 [Candidatus Woesearchaeota archaeon]
MTEQKEMLVAHDVYLKSGIHIGTKFRTKAMEKFIYKTRPDGLSVLNLQKIDERVGIGAKFLTQYAPEDILIICRRENGWKAVKAFGKATGIEVFAKRYPPGILTNIELETFIEKKLILVVDEWADRNAIKDALKMGIAVMALCDTNNNANNIDFIIPCNNKGQKSLGLVFFILAKEYMKEKGMISKDEEMPVKIEDFVTEE